jgi:hypothetical protein
MAYTAIIPARKNPRYRCHTRIDLLSAAIAFSFLWLQRKGAQAEWQIAMRKKKSGFFIRSGKVVIFFIYYAVAGVSHQQHEFSGWIKISNSFFTFFLDKKSNKKVKANAIAPQLCHPSHLCCDRKRKHSFHSYGE